MNQSLIKNIMLWSLIAYGLFMVFNHFNQLNPMSERSIDYSDFIQEVKAGKVKKVELDQEVIYGVFVSGQTFKTFAADDAGLMGDLLNHNVSVKVIPPKKPSLIGQIFVSWFPMILLIGVWIFFMRKMGGGMGGSGGPLSFGKSKARMLSENQIKVTFNDVAGADEAKHEVVEVVDFLKEPAKYEKLGGKIPKGVLLIGPPGTGKTLIAKAIAGEANVPFFTISGSDFVEMFVGVGASRVRDMFENAKNHSPCIIFIDEIDAMGRSRSSNIGGGGNDEREQTLNQMLVEMDGIDSNEGVIIVAATNRPDILDSALLRPGRFDRQVNVPLPDIRGREQILIVHMRNVPHDADAIDPSVIARGTPGFSGADLANLVNEAALMAARENLDKLLQIHFDKAKDKIMMGTERKSMVMTEAEKRMTAYHESGHAIIGYLVPDHDPVYKVSIIPRGRALGVTMYLPEEDRWSYSKTRLQSQLCSLYGGRIAEEIIYGKDYVTTGASNDIERATELARNMVVKWGFSDKLGPLQYEEEDNRSFLGGVKSNFKSSQVATLIDEEVRLLIDSSYERASNILLDNKDKLEVMTDALMKYETIDSKQIDEIMAGKVPGAPMDWHDPDTKDKPPAASAPEIAEEKKEGKTPEESVDGSTKGGLEPGKPTV